MKEEIFVLNSKKKNTNHVLHLILSIVTGGLWLLVWLAVAINNNSYNSKIDSEIGLLMGVRPQPKRISPVVLVLITIAAWLVYRAIDSAGTIATSNPVSKREQTLANISIRSEEFVSELSIMEVDFQITNKSEYAIKDIKIECVNKSKTYADLDKNVRTLYEYINAGQVLRVNKFNMGFVHSQRDFSICKAIDFKFADSL